MRIPSRTSQEPPESLQRQTGAAHQGIARQMHDSVKAAAPKTTSPREEVARRPAGSLAEASRGTGALPGAAVEVVGDASWAAAPATKASSKTQPALVRDQAAAATCQLHLLNGGKGKRREG